MPEKEQMIDFNALARSYVAPIYFFDQEERVPQTNNGTVTLFKKEDKLCGITNYHVYKNGYLDKKECNKNIVCQIGNRHIISLEKKIIHESKDDDAGNDLIVFSLDTQALAEIGTLQDPKRSFSILDTRLPEYLEQYQNENSETWLTHCAGYPGEDKITTQLSDRHYQESFGFHIFRCRATHDKERIILDFSALKESGIQPTVGKFKKENMTFGGMSGGPVFGLTQPSSNDLSLFGIIYEGGGNNSTYEFIYAKPISILEQILK